MKPTFQIYSELQQAYDHFNRELFDGILPECILLLDNKERRVYGYYSAKQFVNQEGVACDAIAMNPQHFGMRKIIEILQTIVHEMVHLWQFHFGTHKSNKVYHNKEWGAKMELLGLMPSSTGQPGGKKTGQCMADYPIEGGTFLQSCERLITPEYKISWMDRFCVREDGLVSTVHALGIDDEGDSESAPEKPNKSNRIKYTCPECSANIWGRPGLNVVCGDCEMTFNPAS